MEAETLDGNEENKVVYARTRYSFGVDSPNPFLFWPVFF
jgi:hypothetical protein